MEEILKAFIEQIDEQLLEQADKDDSKILIGIPRGVEKILDYLLESIEEHYSSLGYKVNISSINWNEYLAVISIEKHKEEQHDRLDSKQRRYIKGRLISNPCYERYEEYHRLR